MNPEALRSCGRSANAAKLKVERHTLFMVVASHHVGCARALSSLITLGDRDRHCFTLDIFAGFEHHPLSFGVPSGNWPELAPLMVCINSETVGFAVEARMARFLNVRLQGLHSFT